MMIGRSRVSPREATARIADLTEDDRLERHGIAGLVPALYRIPVPAFELVLSRRKVQRRRVIHGRVDAPVAVGECPQTTEPI